MSLVGLTRNTSSTHPQFGNKLRVVNLRFGFAMLRSAGTPVRPTPWVYLVATIEQVRSIFPVDSFDDASVSGPVSLPKPLPSIPPSPHNQSPECCVPSLLKQKQLFCLIYFIIACAECSLISRSVGVREIQAKESRGVIAT